MAQLDTWGEVQAYVHERLNVAESGLSYLRVMWSFPATGQAPVMQALEILPLDAPGGPWLRLLAVVAARDEVDLERALRHNHELVVGSLALHGDLVVLRHDVQLPLACEALDAALATLPFEAAKLRHLGTLAPQRRPTASFLAYAID